MIALSGVRSSCDMFARNSDLCWLVVELPVEAIELVVHPVDVRGRGSQLVAIADVDVAEKSPEAIAASRALMRWMGPITDQERRTRAAAQGRSLLSPRR